jgi:addiction module HigA family antidote
MTMKNPPHPGLSVRQDCIEPLDLSITETADILGVTRQTLNNLVNGKSGISPEMAIRLDKAFGGGAETWLRLQMAYDLAQARQHEGEIKVKRVVRRKLDEPRPWSEVKPMARSAPRRTQAIRLVTRTGGIPGQNVTWSEFCNLVRVAARVSVTP